MVIVQWWQLITDQLSYCTTWTSGERPAWHWWCQRRTEDNVSCLECCTLNEVSTLSVEVLLTLWHPLLPYESSYKASCARPGEAVICNFWHPGTLTLRAERQNARMSKITNDGFTWSGAGCFIAVFIWPQWVSKR